MMPLLEIYSDGYLPPDIAWLCVEYAGLARVGRRSSFFWINAASSGASKSVAPSRRRFR